MYIILLPFIYKQKVNFTILVEEIKTLTLKKYQLLNHMMDYTIYMYVYFI